MTPETPYLLRGDPGRLRQILVNLLGNAIKFTPKGEVAIGVELESEDAGTATLRFAITDTGIGLQQHQASNLFLPFVQADGSTTRKYGGTGLGLAIAKQLVALMGGQIGVESDEGKGSQFWFTAVLEKQPAARPPVRESCPALRGVKVLVVEDHAGNRSLVTALLNSWGCRCKDAVDAPSALSALRRAAQADDCFRIALLDMSLRGIDGEELGRRIIADPELHQTKLLLMLPLGGPGDTARFQRVGFAGCVLKPVFETRLREALALALEGGCASAAAEASACGPSAMQTQGKARILLVEDNSVNQEVALAMLGKLGYHTDAVNTGAGALQALQCADYDAVLMDCEMPEMDGYEATRRIRAPGAVRNPQVVIMALTADAMPGTRERCLEAGMNDYLSKPLEPRELAEALTKWLGPAVGNAKLPAPGQGARVKAIFDEEELLQRLMADRVLASKIIAGFLQDVPDQVVQPQKAAGPGQCEWGSATGAHPQGGGGNCLRGCFARRRLRNARGGDGG